MAVRNILRAVAVCVFLFRSGAGVCGEAPTSTVDVASITNAVLVGHAGVGAVVRASSTHRGEPGECEADVITDGNLSTRWSSDYTSPQEVVIDLGRIINVAKLKLHWEKAAATKYSVSVGLDTNEWKSVHLCFISGGEPVERSDEVNMRDVPARAIKLSLQSCVNTNWGYSLYEVEVIQTKGKQEVKPAPAKESAAAPSPKTPSPSLIPVE